MFSVCPPPGEGGYPISTTSTGPMSFPGVPHLHPIILPLVPCPFLGALQGLVPGPFPGEVPNSQARSTPVLAGGTLSWVRSGWRIPLASSRWGIPSQFRMRYPLARLGWGTPHPGDRLCLDRLCRRRYLVAPHAVWIFGVDPRFKFLRPLFSWHPHFLGEWMADLF